MVSLPAHTAVSLFLSLSMSLVQLDSLDDDEDASANGGGAVRPTPLGRVASLYYLQHSTAALIAERFRGRQLTHTEVGEAQGFWGTSAYMPDSCNACCS